MDKFRQTYGKAYEEWHIRLREFMLSQGLNQTNLAKAIGVNTTTINSFFSHAPVDARMQFFVKLKSAYPLLNLNYLFVNQGSMLIENPSELDISLSLVNEPTAHYGTVAVQYLEELQKEVNHLRKANDTLLEMLSKK